MDTLSIFQDIEYDTSVTKRSFRSYYPYDPQRIGKNDVIRIPINNHDGYTQISESYLYIEGTITAAGEKIKESVLTNNAFSYMFDEVRFEINGVEVDCVRNVGHTSTLKGYVSYSENNVRRLENAGWFNIDKKNSTLHETNFDCTIPLKTLMGFFEDFTNVLMGVKQELILIRSSSDNNCFKTNHQGGTPKETPVIQLKSVRWNMLHITLSDEVLAPLLKQINNGSTIYMPYRSWELHERPNLPKTSPISWSVKSTTQLERPRYIILGLQKGVKNNSLAHDVSLFDHCDLRSVRLFLNSEYWPHDPVQYDFQKGLISEAYESYVDFQRSYYGKEAEPLLSRTQYFNHSPIFVIDCSKQAESIRYGTVDIKIEIEARKELPDNTTAYCLLIHDKVVKYTPITNHVTKSL